MKAEIPERELLERHLDLKAKIAAFREELRAVDQELLRRIKGTDDGVADLVSAPVHRTHTSDSKRAPEDDVVPGFRPGFAPAALAKIYRDDPEHRAHVDELIDSGFTDTASYEAFRNFRNRGWLVDHTDGTSTLSEKGKNALLRECRPRVAAERGTDSRRLPPGEIARVIREGLPGDGYRRGWAEILKHPDGRTGIEIMQASGLDNRGLARLTGSVRRLAERLGLEPEAVLAVGTKVYENKKAVRRISSPLATKLAENGEEAA